MKLLELAEKLVAGCRDGSDTANLDTLYAEDAVSVEAVCMPGAESRETHGLEGIKGKHAWWNENMELLDGTISGPFPHGEDRFAVHFAMKVRDKNSGETTEMEEVGVYHVADGKIVREEFFYNMD